MPEENEDGSEGFQHEGGFRASEGRRFKVQVPAVQPEREQLGDFKG
jgi:hypothetical protein